MNKKYIYECNYTNQKIKIDGILNEKAWNKAKPLNFYIPVTNEKPISKTEGKLLWDDKYLYIGFKAYDKDIWGYFTKRDESTCREDCLEIYFKTHSNKEPYYNFEINALGTVLDAFNVRREAAGATHRWSKWNCKGLKVGIKIKGTLNNCEDVDEYWQMEVAIPFKSLPTLRGRAPKENDKWLFHLSRYDYSVYLPKGIELSSCALLSKAAFAYYEDWPVLKFVR